MSEARPKGAAQNTSHPVLSVRWLWQHYATVLAIAYLTLSVFGVGYNIIVCRSLGFDFLYVAQPADFLISFLRRTLAVGMVGFQLLFIFAVATWYEKSFERWRRPGGWFERRKASGNRVTHWLWAKLWPEKKPTLFSWCATSFGTIVVNLVSYAIHDVDRLREGRGETIVMTLNNGAVIGESGHLQLVTITSQYMVLLDENSPSAEAWALSNVRNFRVMKRAKTTTED